MRISNGYHNPETMNLIAQAFHTAWEDLRRQNHNASPQTVRTELAAILLAAATEGERDPERLRAIAVDAVMFSPLH
jgi:hypothetical protein